MRAHTLVICIWVFISSAANADGTNTETVDYSEALSEIIDDEMLGVIGAKIALDALIDSNSDSQNVRAEIQMLAMQVREAVGDVNPSDAELIQVMREVIYISGPWNAYNAFSYDFDNPQGRLARDKSLQNYLTNRRGNCVNMPLLFMAVAEELGIEGMSLTTAPTHIFIQYQDPDSDQVIHLEATSGALPQRIVWQRQVLPMTDRAIETGMYMKRLNRREMIAVLAEVLLQDLNAREEHAERYEVARLILREFPQYDVALLHLQHSAHVIIQNEYMAFYPTSDHIPLAERARFEELAHAVFTTERLLFDLGWRPREQLQTHEQ